MISWKTYLQRILFIVPAILVIFFPGQSFLSSQTENSGSGWEPVGFNGGGLFPVVVVDPIDTATVYLGSDVSGLYRSDDYGDHWHPINDGLKSREISGLAVHPIDSRFLLAGTPEGLFQSHDQGNSWELLNNDIQCYKHVGYHPLTFSSDGNLILAISHRLDGETDGFGSGDFSGIVYRSADMGKTWQISKQFSGQRLSSVMFDPYDSQRAFLVVSGRGVEVSTDGGISWYPFSKGLSGKLNLKNIDIGKDFIYLAGAPTKPFVSGKNHPNWQRIQSDIPEPETGFLPAAPIKVSPQNDYTVYLGQSAWPSVFYQSKNGGKTWRGNKVPEDYHFDKTAAPFQNWADPWQAPFSIAIDPLHPNRIYYTTWYSVWRSEDGGQSWQEKVRGTQNTCCTSLLATEGALISAHMDVGLLSHKAGEPGWLPGWPGQKTDYEDLHAWSLELAADKKIFAAISTNRGPRIVRSDDNGFEWHDTSDGLPDKGMEDFFYVSLAADPGDPATLYLAVDQLGKQGLFRTENAGGRWHRLKTCPGSGTGEARVIKCLEVDAQDSSRIYAGLYWDGLWFSDDKGRSWQRSAAQNKSIAGSSVQKILSLDDGSVLAAVDDGLYISRDKGISFTRISPDLPQLGEASIEYVTSVAVDPVHPDTIFFGTAKNYPIWHNRGSVYQTVDGGKTWQDISANLPIRNTVDLLFANGYLYAAIWCANVYRYRITTFDDSANR